MFWIAPLASAAPVTEADLVEMLDELVPKVEAVAGRKLLARPALFIDDEAGVLAAIGGAGEDDLHALAVYHPASGRIYVVSDVVRAHFSDLGTSSSMVRPFVACVLAHELAHALQHQWAGMQVGDPARAAELGAMREGHASWVAHRVCTGPAETYTSAADGLDIVASVDPEDPQAFAYVYGERWTAAYVERHGVDALWWRLAQPAPTRAEMVGVVAPQLAPGWRDADALADAIEGPLGLAGWDRDAGPVSPTQMLAATGGDRLGAGTVLRASGGMMARVTRYGARVHAMAFLFADAGEANTWITRRSDDLGGVLYGDTVLLTGRSFFGADLQRHDALPPKLRPPGAEATLDYRLRFDDGRPYVEMWARRGPVVYGIVTDGPGTPAALAAGLAALMALPLGTEGPGVAASPGALAALDAPLPPTPLPEPRPDASWLARHGPR